MLYDKILDEKGGELLKYSLYRYFYIYYILCQYIYIYTILDSLSDNYLYIIKITIPGYQTHTAGFKTVTFELGFVTTLHGGYLSTNRALPKVQYIYDFDDILPERPRLSMRRRKDSTLLFVRKGVESSVVEPSSLVRQWSVV